MLAVQSHFAGHRRSFETVEVAAIRCGTRDVADELCQSLRSGGELPFPVPPEPGLVDPPAEEGYLGVVSRGDLPPELAEPVFAASEGGVVGPVRYAGDLWVCVVLLPPRPHLSEAVYALCEAALTGEAPPGTG